MKEKRGLIVEDDFLSRGAIGKLFESSEYETHPCADPDEGMISPRNVFSDTVMTGHSSDEVEERAIALGMGGPFEKPVVGEKLFGSLEALCGSSKAGGPSLLAGHTHMSLFGPLMRKGLLAFLLFLFWFFHAPYSMAGEPFADPNRPSFRQEVRWDCTRTLSNLLSAEQLKALRELQSAFYSESAPIRRELTTLTLEFRQLLADSRSDPALLFDRKNKILELQSKLQRLSLTYQIKARTLFTNLQLERLPRDCMLGMGTEFGLNIGIGRGPRRGLRR